MKQEDDEGYRALRQLVRYGSWFLRVEAGDRATSGDSEANAEGLRAGKIRRGPMQSGFLF